MIRRAIFNKHRVLQFQIAILAAAVPALLFAYAEGPDAGLAGVPGENNCTACHSGSSGSGNVQVTFPNGATYTPGAAQHLVVTITDSSQRRWGFELTARQSGNTRNQAGTFTPGSDGYTQLVCTQTTFQTESFGRSCPSSMPMQYIEHTLSGTRLGARSPVTFAFDWTPPATNVGNINVYISANGDGNISGDHIYLKNYTLTPAPSNVPAIAPGGVVNAASFQPGITTGSWVTIQGTNLANSTRSWNASDIVNGALPTQLDGVSVTIDGNPAYVSYISPTQINAQAPSDDNVGPVSVQVTNNGAASAPVTAQLQAVSPAFFVWSNTYAVATHADYSLAAPPTLFPNLATVPAKPGEAIILWGTGFGATTPPMPAGQQVPGSQIYSVANPPSITIGGVPVPVIGAALTPGLAGLYQILVQVPDSLPDGDQPVVAQTNGVASPTGIYLTVQH
ncbi:MAG: choice-of-anchor V domain-containing protein [Bryobacteraceae bacterium]